MKIIKEQDLRKFVREGRINRKDALSTLFRPAKPDERTPEERIADGLDKIAMLVIALTQSIGSLNEKDPSIKLAIEELTATIRAIRFPQPIQPPTPEPINSMDVAITRNRDGKIESLRITRNE